jgi:hypothetical protein
LIEGGLLPPRFTGVICPDRNLAYNWCGFGQPDDTFE